jgi:hypothetical protein
MPSIDSGWLDQHQRFPPAGPEPAQEQPKQPVNWAKALIRTSEDAELVAKAKCLEQEIPTRCLSRSGRRPSSSQLASPRRLPNGDANVNEIGVAHYWRGTALHHR